MKPKPRPARTEYERWALKKDGKLVLNPGSETPALYSFKWFNQSSKWNGQISLEPGECVVRVKVSVEEVVNE